MNRGEIADMYAAAADAFRKATGVSCVKDRDKWISAIEEGKRLEALADQAASEYYGGSK